MPKTRNLMMARRPRCIEEILYAWTTMGAIETKVLYRTPRMPLSSHHKIMILEAVVVNGAGGMLSHCLYKPFMSVSTLRLSRTPQMHPL